MVFEPGIDFKANIVAFNLGDPEFTMHNTVFSFNYDGFSIVDAYDLRSAPLPKHHLTIRSGSQLVYERKQEDISTFVEGEWMDKLDELYEPFREYQENFVRDAIAEAKRLEREE